ncbi:MAG: cytochrome c1 [Alphaproteobacteria bacterium]|jgi:ubiquinol-cytochrome c reductase cytochrome c1 subunit|nr:cytochrome c1 [Alphaproteobacteria bacterium]MBT7942394.1 cytochrome c1 [Alphaproteobacteria bacterium]
MIKSLKKSLNAGLAVLALSALVSLSVTPTQASESKESLPTREWSFNGMFGTFDRGSLQRGLQVYKEVCAGCHSLRLVAYRNLSSIGLSEDQIKAIAAEFEVTDGPNAEGEMYQRPARPSDRFVSPFANDNAARASNNGALPPDLSLMVKSRKGGADYLHALLTHYKEEAPAGVTLGDGMQYNTFFPGNQIAMAPPLDDDAVEYADGTKATLEQLSIDVSTFLAWAAEPELEERKRLGIKVLLFLIVLTGMMYALKRQVWADQH